MSHSKITDSAFDRALSLREAYRLMVAFIEQYHARGEGSTADLIADLSITMWGDGSSADPAQLQDFLKVSDVLLEGGPAVG